jgi:hypothetical protein
MRPYTHSKESNLCVWTRQVVETMMRLKVFTKHSIISQMRNNSVSLRRIDDITAILLGAGFLKKDLLIKKHYVFVGIEGTRRIHDAFKTKKNYMFKNAHKRSQYYGWKFVQLLSRRHTWTIRGLREQFSKDVAFRRSYDVLSIFLGASLIRQIDNTRVVLNIENNRKVLTISDEVAISILPELEQHLQKREVELFF